MTTANIITSPTVVNINLSRLSPSDSERDEGHLQEQPHREHEPENVEHRMSVGRFAPMSHPPSGSMLRLLIGSRLRGRG